MRAFLLMRSRSSLLAVLLLLAGAPTAFAQSMSVSGGTGWVAYSWSNLGRTLAPGDTLRVREVLVSTADTMIAVRVHPCGVEVEGEIGVRKAEETCSEPVRQLAPGDSAWAEKRWIITSPPGTYYTTIRVSGTHEGKDVVGGSSSTRVEVVPADSRRKPRAAGALAGPPERVPFVLHFARTDDALPITAQEVDGVVRQAIRTHESRLIPMPASPAAASAMAAVAPYLRLDVRLGGGGRYRLTRCWIGAGADQLSERCDTAAGGLDSATVFGAVLADFVEREVQRKG